MIKPLSCFRTLEAGAPWPIDAHIPRMVLPGLTPGMGRKGCMILAVWVEPGKQGAKDKGEIQIFIDPYLQCQVVGSFFKPLLWLFASKCCIRSLRMAAVNSAPDRKWLRTTIWTHHERRTTCHLSHSHCLLDCFWKEPYILELPKTSKDPMNIQLCYYTH